MANFAFITGATRGIGKACALRLAAEGWNIVVAAKSTEEDPRIPGTIYSAAEEIARLGVEVLPVRCNVRDADEVRAAVRRNLDICGASGGIVIGPTHMVEPEVPWENLEAMRLAALS